MKRLLLAGLLLPAVVSAGVMTVPVTRVVPKYVEVAVTRQICTEETVTPSEGNPVLGAVIGGVIGSQVAGKGNKTAGAGVGAIAGAVIGDHAGKQPTKQMRCVPETRYEQQPQGFMVYFKIGDTELSQHMNVNPGQWVTVTITAR